MTEPDKLIVSAEVPGTPEEVWEAIATGPGISSWFMPAEVDQREGGEVTHVHGAGEGASSTGVITAWEPPRRFAYEEELGEDGRLATEFLVEARSGSTCVVRIVSSAFGAGDSWQGMAESMRSGWTAALHALTLYRAHFKGRRGASMRAWGHGEGPVAEAWSSLKASLELDGAAVGDRVVAGGGAPPLAGEVVAEEDLSLTLLVDSPEPGIAHLIVADMGDSIGLVVDAFYYGDGAAERAAERLEAWQGWMDER